MLKIKHFLFGILLALPMLFIACSDDDNETNPSDEIKKDGFVISGTTSSGVLALYLEDVPTGTLDLSSGTDFQQFFPTALYDHAMYMTRTDKSPGFAKVVVDGNGEFKEVGIIPTNDPPNVISFRIAVRDAETGVYQDRSRPNTIIVFDPETLETTGEIDMSAAPEPVEGAESRYQRFVFRGDDIFSPIRENVSGNLYSGFYLHQANLAGNSYAGATGVDAPYSGGILTVNNFGQGLLDNAGNLYFQDGGAIGTGTFSRIYKIPAGSNEIDESYVFEPVKQLNPQNIFYPTMNGFKIVSGSKAVAKVNAEVPQAVIDIILSMPGETFAEKINALRNDPEAIQQVQALLFTSESASWCELDLAAQTVTPIVGIPKSGTSATNSIIFEHDGDIYIPIATTTEQAFYKYTPGNPVGTKAFDVTGADLIGAYNLANNN